MLDVSGCCLSLRTRALLSIDQANHTSPSRLISTEPPKVTSSLRYRFHSLHSTLAVSPIATHLPPYPPAQRTYHLSPPTMSQRLTRTAARLSKSLSPRPSSTSPFASSSKLALPLRPLPSLLTHTPSRAFSSSRRALQTPPPTINDTTVPIKLVAGLAYLPLTPRVVLTLQAAHAGRVRADLGRGYGHDA